MFLEENPFQDKSDNELVALSLENKNNFLFLMKRYEDKLRRYVFRISNASQDEADDILQEIFIKTYRYLNNFNQDLQFSSWIYRIAHNHIISRYRYHSRRPKVVEVEEGFLENLASELNLGENLDKDIIGKKVQNIISKLKENHRNAIILRFLEEKSYEEIADILEKPVGTVATLIFKAKKEFKNIWEKEIGQKI